MAAWLGVQRGEGRSTGLMTAHSFFMGLSTVFFETAASALFLAAYGAAALPWVYLAAAVLNTVTGVAYTSVRQRVSFATLMGGTVVFLLVSVAGFRGAMALTESVFLSFGLLVFYRVLSILTDLEYWAVAARLYNVRQAKRLFGLIGSGEVVARIAGAFAVPLLVAVVGVPDLVTLSAVALLGCLVVLLPVLKLIPGDAADAGGRVRPAAKHSAWHHLRVLLGNRYLTIIVALAALAVLGKYFVDFAFLQQMNSRYDDVKGLAGFFGVFSGVSQAVSLLTRVFLSGRILSRYGVGTGLVILPAAHILCTGAIVAMGSAATAPVAVFWLAVLNQGIYKTLKHPIDNPSFKVLYQPLRREQRLSAQIAVETIVTPITIGIAGAVMLLFSLGITFRPVHFAWVMLVSFVGWLALARIATGEYRQALMRALRSRLVDHETLSLSDEPSLAIVREKLDSEAPGDVIFALDLLERFEHEDTVDLLLARVDHPLAPVRRYVLQRLEVLRPPAAVDAVRLRAAQEDNPAVQAAALRCLAALDRGAEGASRVAGFLGDPDLQVRRGAIVGLLSHASDASREAARASLEALATADDPHEREVAARTLGEVGGAEFAPTLLPLLSDPAAEVRRAALTAAPRVAAPEVWRAVIDSLGSTMFGLAAAASLASMGPAVLDLIGERLQRETNRLVSYRLIWICGRIGGPSAIALLRPHIDHPALVLRLQVLESLARCGYRADGRDGENVRESIRREAQEAAWRASVALAIGEESRLAFLRQALDREDVEARRRVLALLALLGDAETMLRASENVAHELKEKRAYAMELLELAIPSDLRDIVMPLAEELSPAARLARLAESYPQAPRGRDERVTEVILHPAPWLRPWTRACAILGAGHLRIEGLASTLDACPPDGPMVRETLAWARGGEQGGAMLTVEKVMILKGVQMFARTPEEVLEDLAAIVEEVDLKKGDVIFRKGDPGDSMYIIVDGSVRVYDGDRTINVLKDRDIFGELALLDPEPRSASIQALEDTSLFRIDRETFSELMAGSISIVRGVLHVLCERLRRAIPVARAIADETDPGTKATPDKKRA